MRKERGRKQAVRFSPRSEGKRGDNVQTKGYYGTKGNVVLLYICSAVVRTRINGFTVKKKKSLGKKFQRKKVLGNTFSGKGW